MVSTVQLILDRIYEFHVCNWTSKPVDVVYTTIYIRLYIFSYNVWTNAWGVSKFTLIDQGK